MKKKKTLIAAALLTVATIGPAQAQAPGEWNFQAAIYGYFPSIGGKTRFPASGGGSDASVDVDTILEHLKFVFMGSIEARKGHWGVWGDVVYLDVGDSKDGTRAISIGNTGLPAGVDAHVDFDLKGWIASAGASYRVVSKPGYALDVIAGARVLDARQKLDWRLTGNIGAIPLVDRSGNRETDLQNWDAIVGVKGRASFGEGQRWFVPYYLDIGTGESQLTWQAMSGIGYAFGWGEVIGAWRYIDYDMKSGKAIEELDFNGPAIAFVFRW